MNHGVIEGQRDTDYVAGESSPLGFEYRNPSGDWTPYLPVNEKQYSNLTDTMACVSYSFINSIEMQHKLLMGYERNFSDRWLAKLSDTTPQGNYLWKVADTARTLGLVDQAVWPEPPNYDWSTYYAPIPQSVIDLGKSFLNNFDISYEWVPIGWDTINVIKLHLKHAPLQVVLPGHAVVQIVNEDSLMKYFDTYHPHVKSTDQSRITSALKIVLTPKNMTQFKTQNYKGELRIVLQASDMEQWKALCKVYGVNPDVITETIT